MITFTKITVRIASGDTVGGFLDATVRDQHIAGIEMDITEISRLLAGNVDFSAEIIWARGMVENDDLFGPVGITVIETDIGTTWDVYNGNDVIFTVAAPAVAAVLDYVKNTINRPENEEE